jgi:hypothetical protein
MAGPLSNIGCGSVSKSLAKPGQVGHDFNVIKLVREQTGPCGV